MKKTMNSEEFEKIFLSVFDNHTLLKKKVVWTNQMLYATKQHINGLWEGKPGRKDIINQKA